MIQPINHLSYYQQFTKKNIKTKTKENKKVSTSSFKVILNEEIKKQKTN